VVEKTRRTQSERVLKDRNQEMLAHGQRGCLDRSHGCFRQHQSGIYISYHTSYIGVAWKLIYYRNTQGHGTVTAETQQRRRRRHRLRVVPKIQKMQSVEEIHSSISTLKIQRGKRPVRVYQTVVHTKMEALRFGAVILGPHRHIPLVPSRPLPRNIVTEYRGRTRIFCICYPICSLDP
jgi:hypothetical protein